MVYGYARVSTKEQNEARQLIALREAGVDGKHVFMDKQSGKSFDRPAWAKLMLRVRGGDTIVVKSIDRLGRNYDELLDQWRTLTSAGVGIKVLDMPLLDTSKERDLTGRLIADIVLQLLSYVAETERENIKRRQSEGIRAAQERGVRFGRPAKPLPESFESVCQDWQCGLISQSEGARRCSMPLSSFRYHLNNWLISNGILDYKMSL